MKKTLKIIGLILGSLLLLVLIFALYVNFRPLKTYENKAPDLQVSLDSVRIAEGRRIASVLCNQCHSSGDGKLGGALMEESALGTIYAPNITKDPEHGIGNYTDG